MGAQTAARAGSLPLRSAGEARTELRVRAFMTFVSTSQRTELYSFPLSITFESLFWPHELLNVSFFQAR